MPFTIKSVISGEISPEITDFNLFYGRFYLFIDYLIAAILLVCPFIALYYLIQNLLLGLGQIVTGK